MASKAMGGGDEPEDVIGALERGLKFKHEASTLLVYLIADAPSHGKEYQPRDYCHDDHPDANRKGQLEDLMRQYKGL